MASDAVPLLRIPAKFNSVDEVLGAAQKMELPNVIVISELGDGNVVFLSTDMTAASTNWLLDRLKILMLIPNSYERVGPRKSGD